MLENLHIMPSVFEEEDFYRLNEVLSALPAEDRVKTGRDFLSDLGITEENTTNKF
ncbi:hypothetical protein [Leuconostoc gasicomitatum]|uniref:hypothetical protein n=1 Tax=Leuconostoc gasicomitatum TaxID=115778 RepID=UPI0015D8A8C1|nr:hypothetical protein [Leuconostoc gasicomitatum]